MPDLTYRARPESRADKSVNGACFQRAYRGPELFYTISVLPEEYGTTIEGIDGDAFGNRDRCGFKSARMAPTALLAARLLFRSVSMHAMSRFPSHTSMS